MLKIGKKEELKAEGVSSVYAAEEQTEQPVLKAIREKQYLDWQHIQSLLHPLPSLPAPIIAEILQKTLATLQEDGIQTALDGILQLVAFPQYVFPYTATPANSDTASRINSALMASYCCTCCGSEEKQRVLSTWRKWQQIAALLS
jgi:hypothetical protein